MSDELFTRASEAAADKLCPGRWYAQQAAPESSGVYAEYGRMMHEALSTGDTSKLNPQQRDSYDQCRVVEALAISKYFGVNAHKAAENPIRERELTLAIDGFTHKGHPDVIYRLGKQALIPDYKSLRGEVEDASLNDQLRDYAVLYDHSTSLLDEIATVIIQPLVTMNPEICVYDRESLDRSYSEMRERIIASRSLSGKSVAGNTQCQWCRAKNLCAEYQKWASGNLPVPRSIVDVPVSQWTPEQCAAFCEHKGAAAKWLKECEEEMKKRLRENPDSIPGFCLAEGNAVDVLTDLDLIYNRYIQLGGKHEKFMESLKGVKIKGKLEELVRECTGAKGRGLKSAVDSLIAGASEKKQNEPSIKRKDQT